MTPLAQSLIALVDRQVAAGRSRGEVLAALRAWVEGEERKERRRACEAPGCRYDAVLNEDGRWFCGGHISAWRRAVARGVTR